MKCKLFVFFTLFGIFLFPTSVLGETNASNYTAEYDAGILEAFKNDTWVPVLVRLVDNSNITITGTKDERRVLSKQVYDWFQPVIDEVLGTLSGDEFRLIGKRSDGFEGYVTKEGFDKLLVNAAVRKIIWSNWSQLQLTTNENNSIEVNLSKTEEESNELLLSEPFSEEEMYKEKSNLPWILIVAGIILLEIILIAFILFKKKR
jgi:hypothetical protein